MKMNRNVGTTVRSVAAPGSAAFHLLVAAICTTVLCSAACNGRRVLVFTTGTVIGIEATAEEGVEQHLIVGVKRFEGAVVPTVPADGTGPREEAYSVFATLGFSTGLLEATRIVQTFGTGEAAMTLAGSPAALSNITSAARGVAVADYNVDSISQQDRIAAWLDGPSSAERRGLREWLRAELAVETSEALWLVTAPSEQLSAAIIQFDIP